MLFPAFPATIEGSPRLEGCPLKPPPSSWYSRWLQPERRRDG